jgi:hypothetical protein
MTVTESAWAPGVPRLDGMSDYTLDTGLNLCGKVVLLGERSGLVHRGARARFLSPPPPTGPGPTTFLTDHPVEIAAATKPHSPW